MHRTTIMLPDDLRTLLTEEAHKRGISPGSLIRQALLRELSQGEAGTDAFLSDERLAVSPLRNMAENHDDYLDRGKP